MLRRRKKRPRQIDEEEDADLPVTVPIYTTKRLRPRKDELDPEQEKEVDSLVFGDEAGMLSALTERAVESDEDEVRTTWPVYRHTFSESVLLVACPSCYVHVSLLLFFFFSYFRGAMMKTIRGLLLTKHFASVKPHGSTRMMRKLGEFR